MILEGIMVAAPDTLAESVATRRLLAVIVAAPLTAAVPANIA